jgi:putative CocE/NonD family hydrolase
VESDLRAFAKLSKRSPNHRIMIGPWAHSVGYKFKDVDFGPDAIVGLRQFQLAWFDRWLRPETRKIQNDPDAPVRIFVMGINQWRDEQEWPLARAVPTPMYLVSGGEANGLSGDGTLSWKTPRRNQPPDHFVYDPADPVPTAGGSVCCNPKVFPWGPMDQRKIETRSDVLVYTSDPFLEDIEVTGPIEWHCTWPPRLPTRTSRPSSWTWRRMDLLETFATESCG